MPYVLTQAVAWELILYSEELLSLCKKKYIHVHIHVQVIYICLSKCAAGTSDFLFDKFAWCSTAVPQFVRTQEMLWEWQVSYDDQGGGSYEDFTHITFRLAMSYNTFNTSGFTQNLNSRYNDLDPNKQEPFEIHGTDQSESGILTLPYHPDTPWATCKHEIYPLPGAH